MNVPSFEVAVADVGDWTVKFETVSPPFTTLLPVLLIKSIQNANVGLVGAVDVNFFEFEAFHP